MLIFVSSSLFCCVSDGPIAHDGARLFRLPTAVSHIKADDEASSLARKCADDQFAKTNKTKQNQSQQGKTYSKPVLAAATYNPALFHQ